MTELAHPAPSSRPVTLLRSAAIGAAAGVVGAAVMALGEKVEQSITGRSNSYVPGRTLATMIGRPVGDSTQPLIANQIMHYVTGAALGALRGVWAVVGIRGLRADVTHTVARLAFDQTLENASGTGAPPHTWPLREQLVDYGHKGVYAFVTGAVADRWVRPRLQSTRGVTSH
jgi:hypothetical protein